MQAAVELEHALAAGGVITPVTTPARSRLASATWAGFGRAATKRGQPSIARAQ
jgi:hypothetical protein